MLKRSIQVLGSGLDYIGVRPVVTLHNGRPHWMWPDGKLLPVVAGGAVDDVIERDASDDPLIPTPVSAQIIKEMPQSSAVMRLARRVTMSTKSQRQPVLNLLPEAYFVSGDQGLKQTTRQDWANLTLVAEEMAVIVVIPDNYFDDAQVPIWDEVRPEISAAFGRKFDRAALFGVDKPSTWGDAINLAADAKGNVVIEGEGVDLADDIRLTAMKVAEDGFGPDGFASGPTLDWRLVGLRDLNNQPIFSSPRDGLPGSIYGRTFGQTKNGGWDDSRATLIAGDWTKAIVGVRQDITFRLFSEGVISDADGTVIVNLMQQDSKALRATIRLGWVVANPVTALNQDAGTRYPFAVLEPSAAS